ncbi:MAG: hypothetical protein U1E24_03950, partial [Phenylobacterium sp.]|nr:hypothetical protein [Phenylobacterium sp.]
SSGWSNRTECRGSEVSSPRHYCWARLKTGFLVFAIAAVWPIASLAQHEDRMLSKVAQPSLDLDIDGEGGFPCRVAACSSCPA